MVEKNQSMIDRSMAIVGEVKCTGRVLVRGRIDGNFNAGTLTVGESGEITGKTTADEIVCRGRIEGHVITDKFVMRKNGCHCGMAETKLLEVDPGATLDYVLQRGGRRSPPPPASRIDLEGICSVFDERKKHWAGDALWSARKDLLNQMISLLQRGKQLIKITGESGSGKTTFLRILKEKLAPDAKLFVINEPVGSVKDLVIILAAELGIITEQRDSQQNIVHRIRDAAFGPGVKKSRIILALDDAHMMYPATLEGMIRYLTTVSGASEELLQIILMGTDELEGRLVPTTREYFEDETNCLLTLEPLTVGDTAEYLRFCVRLASNSDARVCMSLFPYETIKKLQTRSRGNISEINRLASRILLTALKTGLTEIDSR